MNRTKIVHNAEAYVQAFKTILENDALADLPKASRDAETALENIKAVALADTRVRSAMETLEEQAKAFTRALQGSDRQQAAKALILMEEAVQNIREVHTVAEKVGMPDGGALPDE